MRWLASITDSAGLSLSELQEAVKDREARRAWGHWGRKESDTTERLNSNKIRYVSWQRRREKQNQEGILKTR